MSKFVFTSESVTEGHPDKVCDQISDAVLDSIIAQDPTARVACETFCTTGRVNIMGEITTTAQVDIEAVARKVVNEIGYDSDIQGFNGNTCDVSVFIDKQSADIALGVDKSLEAKHGESDTKFENGAGDQGMMFGYACDETEELMPLAISLAHSLSRRLTEVRKNGTLPYLRPDGKSQVTVEYNNGVPTRVEAVVVSSQHRPEIDLATLRNDILTNVIKPIIPSRLLDKDTKIFINPTGRFVVGGPEGDTGLTGRKIIVDTYGGRGAHGGGAFSGKDPSKVDRSAAYAARHVAKNLVAAGVADEVLVQVAYAIGVAEPVSICVNTYGTSHVDVADAVIAEKVAEIFDMRPFAIERRLKLRNPIYSETAAYGHVGRTPQTVVKKFSSRYEGDMEVEVELFTWEKLDYVDAIKAAFSIKN